MSETVFIIGDVSSAEFASSISLLAEHILRTDSQILQLPEVCLNTVNRQKRLAGISADFFILLQSYPSQFASTDIVALKRNEPFSPVLLIAGCCCEGANRTAPVLPGVFRFYASQVNEQTAAEVSSFLTGKSSLFSLPYPVSDEEIILKTISVNCSTAKKPLTETQNPQKYFEDSLCLCEKKNTRQCCIVNRFGPLGNDPAMNELLADIYRQQGFSILSVSFDLPQRSENCPHKDYLPKDYNGKIAADADDSPFPQILESFQRIRRYFADSDITGYISSPRINEKTALFNAGVNQVLHKL